MKDIPKPILSEKKKQLKKIDKKIAFLEITKNDLLALKDLIENDLIKNP